MTLDGSVKRVGKIALLSGFIVCFVIIGIFSIARETRGAGSEKLKLKKVFKVLPEKGGLERVEPGPEMELVFIKGEVLTVGVVGKTTSGLGESFIYVHNKADIGEDVIVCFMPGWVSDVFALALAKDYPIRAWGFEIAPPELYEEVTTKGYVVLAARVLNPDVPSGFTDLGIIQDFPSGGGAELK